jgi:hypothetical protein
MTTFYDIDNINHTLAEQAAMINRQRIAIETLLAAIQAHFDTGCNQPLQDAYLAVSSSSTMTGSSEQ